MKYKVKIFSPGIFELYEDYETIINDWLSSNDIEVINISCNKLYLIILYKEMGV